MMRVRLRIRIGVADSDRGSLKPCNPEWSPVLRHVVVCTACHRVLGKSFRTM